MDSKGFRGESGEVVRGFLTAGTWMTALPVGLATVMLAILAAFAQERLKLPSAVVVPAFLTLLAPITGLFAMAARSGHVRAGFLDALAEQGLRSAGGFSLRYGVLQAAWSIPLVVLVQQSGQWLTASIASGPGTPMTLAVWGACSVVVASLLLPSLTLLIATRTNSLREAFSTAAWRWALRERRDDLVPFVASALGWMMLFLLAALPPLAIVLPLVADLSPTLAQGLLMALPVLPWATTPILLGRLAGAFVAAEPARAEAAPAPAASPSRGPSTFDVPVPQAGRTMAGLAGIPVGNAPSYRMDCPTNMGSARQPGTQGVPLGVAVARAHQLAATDPAAALAELDALRSAHPRNPAVLAELSRVLKQAGRTEDALATAASAIRLALGSGAGPIAHDVFRAFAHDAAQLHLEPAIYEQLARILCARREFDGAAWCYRAAAALGGDPRVLQKGMLSVAEAAVSAGHLDKAIGAYEAFVATWPDSPLSRFAKEGADDVRRRLQGAPSAT